MAWPKQTAWSLIVVIVVGDAVAVVDIVVVAVVAAE